MYYDDDDDTKPYGTGVSKGARIRLRIYIILSLLLYKR